MSKPPSKSRITKEVLKADNHNLKIELAKTKKYLAELRVHCKADSQEAICQIEALNERVDTLVTQRDEALREIDHDSKLPEINANLLGQIQKGHDQVYDLKRTIENLEEQIKTFQNMEARLADYEAAKKARRDMHSSATRENVYLRRTNSAMKLAVASMAEDMKALGDAGKPLAAKMLAFGSEEKAT